MADSRRIIPPRTGVTLGDQQRHADHPRQIPVAALGVGTDRVNVEGTPAAPSPLLAGSARRRSALIYYPSTDPVSSTVNSADLFVCGDVKDAPRSFPIPPGGTLSVELSGWLYAYTADGSEPTIYVLALED